MAQELRRSDFELLRWDSEFFGFPVARILPEKSTKEDLAKILSALTAAKVKVAYWATDPGCNTTEQAALDSGAFLADRKTTYATPIHSSRSKTGDGKWRAEEFRGVNVPPDLDELALEAGKYSRFRTDPFFTEQQWSLLYLKWIEGSIFGRAADTVFVVRHSKHIVGMTCVKNAADYAQIGLIAVSPSMRGKGIGRALIDEAKAWAGDRRQRKLRVVTQADNLPACELYKKCGFLHEKTQHVYHIWLR